MIIWLDAQLSPGLAPWIQATFGIETLALRDLGLRDATDRAIFEAARTAGAIVMTKDSDFTTLYDQTESRRRSFGLRAATPRTDTCANY
jgi:predicted nuclease of predicted toxin-antitoxin system